MMKADAGWIDEFKARYAAWWPEARPMIERHDYATAFKTYPRPTVATAPWTPVRKPLAESRVGVVTTGGLYREGVDTPFAGDAPEGDWSFRAIPADMPIQTLRIAHAHFAHEVAEADMNTIFPLDRLRELRSAGLIGGLADTHFSVMGYCTRAADLAEGAAPAIAAGLQAAGADVALVVPVWPVCHQSGGLVQREIEAWGIPTISLSNNPGATQRICPPRWAHVRFPRGSMLGEPGNHAKQKSVLTDTLRALAAIDTPGGSVELPYRWEADPVMWRGKPLRESSNS